MEETTEQIIAGLPKVLFKDKPEKTQYDPALLNFKDVNELKTVINTLIVAFGDEMRRKDAIIAGLTEQVDRHERQINLGLVEAGLVQLDYLQSEPAKP